MACSSLSKALLSESQRGGCASYSELWEQARNPRMFEGCKFITGNWFLSGNFVIKSCSFCLEDFPSGAVIKGVFIHKFILVQLISVSDKS